MQNIYNRLAISMAYTSVYIHVCREFLKKSE